VDCCQVPLVPVLHVLHTALLHVLRDDGGWLDSQRNHSGHYLIGVLQRVEPLLRISDPPTCKQLSSWSCKFHFNDCLWTSTLHRFLITHDDELKSSPSLFFFFRNCLSGGGGTAGSAQSHGHSTDWLPPNSATSRIRWRTHRQARRWRSSSRITSASITTSCGLSQGCTSG
jgi:hypothetical protein